MTSVTLSEAREAIYQRFVANLPAALGVNYTFANENYAPPAEALWARLIISHESGIQDSLGKVGDRKFLRKGRVLVQVHGPSNSGLRSIDLVSDEIRDIFEGASFSGLYFISADIREIGVIDEWYQYTVDAPFEYQETR